MTESVAKPADTVGGHTELVREWHPVGDPWAGVVVVHGLGEHSGRYERVGSFLAAAGMWVRSFDLIGFGATSGRLGHVEDWTLYLDQVESHLGAVRARQLPQVLLGHSLGGLIALEYCLSERPSPAAAVLSAPALAGGAAWQRRLAPILARLAPTLPVPNNIKGEQLSRDPEVGEAYFSDPLVLLKTTPRLGAEFFAAIDRCQRHLTDLATPTLVIHGGADTVVPPHATAHISEHPMAERWLYPSLRHELFNEPEGLDVLGDVLEWLQRNVTKKP